MSNLISAGRIVDYAAKLGIAPGFVVCEDPLFRPFIPSFISGELGAALTVVLGTAKLSYSDAFDCNRFSKLATAVADMSTVAGLKDTVEEEIAPCAFGTFAFWQDNGGGHSICVGVHWTNDGDIEFRFYEPQKGLAEVKLSKQEIASCVEMRFA